MKTVPFRLIFLIFFTLLASVAIAQPQETPPRTATPFMSPADAGWGAPIGSAKLTLFGFDIYMARLWASAAFSRQDYARQPFALELTYLRDFKGLAIAERSIKEMRRVETITEAQGREWLGVLTRTLPDVRKGERLTGIYNPGVGLRFLFNDRPLADVKDPAFARVFMGIWLSPQTSEPAMREALLAEVAP